jgi:hypothetical protein
MEIEEERWTRDSYKKVRENPNQVLTPGNPAKVLSYGNASVFNQSSS